MLESEQFEIAVMPPGQLAVEVLVEKSAFDAQQQSTEELERPRDYLQCNSCALVRGPFEALPGHPEQACRLLAGKHRGVLRPHPV